MKEYNLVNLNTSKVDIWLTGSRAPVALGPGKTLSLGELTAKQIAGYRDYGKLNVVLRVTSKAVAKPIEVIQSTVSEEQEVSMAPEQVAKSDVKQQVGSSIERLTFFRP